MARIATVYHARREPFTPVDMSGIRWLKISEALARRGHHVDMVTAEPPRNGGRALRVGAQLRRVALERVRWGDYDVVKTLFHIGFETLEAAGGAKHSFIVSKLGSVVAPEDRDGIHFHGTHRERLFATQRRIAERAAFVTLLSEPALELWRDCFGPRDNLLLVPGATERELPRPGPDPFPQDGRRRCLFAGNVYDEHAQPEANRVIVDKLNHLGELLSRQGVRLYLLGRGDVRRVDPASVTYLGVAPYEASWDYLRHADVGLVVSAGAFMHNNESTKIYHYLRVGLPVVSEAGFPNDLVVREAGLGYVVRNGGLAEIARRVTEAAAKTWDREAAIAYILARHTWDRRVEVYDALLRARFGEPRPAGELVETT